MADIRAALAVADAADLDGSRPLDVDDFKVERTGAAKETTQLDVVAALETLVAALASPASQTTLAAILARLSETLVVESAPGATFDTGLEQPLTDSALRAAPVPVSGTLTDDELRDSPVPVSGAVQMTSAAAAVTSVNDSNVSQTLLAANADRKGFSIYNDSTVVLYVKFGAAASATDHTVQIPPAALYESPGALSYTGRIDGVWSADASGAARITELT